MIRYQKKYINNRGGGIFLNLLLVLTILSASLFFYQQKTVCEKPLKYSVGSIDNNFNIEKSEFLDIITDAEDIWENGMGMDLFTYDPNADFKINLIFDERQQETITEKGYREILDSKNNIYNDLVKKYEELKKYMMSNLKNTIPKYMNMNYS